MRRMSMLAVLLLAPIALSGGTKSPLKGARMGDHIYGPKVKEKDLRAAYPMHVGQFANPAVTIARSLTDTFSGINPAHAPMFILAQLVGALVAWLIWRSFESEK